MNETTKRLIAIFTFALLLRVALLADASPFYRDEALYAEVISEMLNGGSTTPHYWGLAVPWKPPITFWVYSAFIAILSPAGLPPEFLYRLPSAILGAVCSVLVYLIVKEAREGDDLALISSVAFAGSALALFVNRMLLVDSLLLFFTLSSILCYLKANGRAKLLFLGGLLAGLAVFTKTFAGLFAPVVVIAYFAFYERKTLFNLNFLFSLFCVPLAFFALFFFIPGMLSQSFVDSTQRTAGSDMGHAFAVNLITFLSLTLPWSGLAIYGAWRYWGTTSRSKLWGAWLLLGLLPLFTNGPLFWYFLPLIPAIAVFSGKAVLAGGKADKFAVLFSLLLVAMSVGAAYVISQSLITGDQLESQRDLGAYLGGKDSLVISRYVPTALYYASKSGGDYNTASAFFFEKQGEPDSTELKQLINESKLPPGSIRIDEGLLYPYTPARMYVGEFREPKVYFALEKEAYARFIEGNSAYFWFEKTYENEFFVVIARKAPGQTPPN